MLRLHNLRCVILVLLYLLFRRSANVTNEERHKELVSQDYDVTNEKRHKELVCPDNDVTNEERHKELVCRDYDVTRVRDYFRGWEREGRWSIVEWTIPERTLFPGQDALVQVYQVRSNC